MEVSSEVVTLEIYVCLDQKARASICMEDLGFVEEKFRLIGCFKLKLASLVSL